MKNYEALELQAKAMRLVEGTKLDWYQTIKVNGYRWVVAPSFDAHSNCYELALAVVEGKPVFNGDHIWREDYPVAQHVDSIWFNETTAKECSWNPPKPRTVMVELLVEDAKYFAYGSAYKLDSDLGNACRKALEELK